MHLRCAGLDALLGRKAPRSLSTKTKSRVDEAIRSYGYRAASHVETSTRAGGGARGNGGCVGSTAVELRGREEAGQPPPLAPRRSHLAGTTSDGL
jgi:hypothetical protein